MTLRNLRSGDRVALLVPGSTAYVEAVLGLLAAEIVPVPLDPRLTPREREAILADVDPALVVEDPAEVVALAATYPVGLPRARPMHVTSGTTGRPKGVWSGILTVDAARALVDEEHDLWGFTADDVHLVMSPLHHSAPLRFAMGTLLAGGRVVGLDGLDHPAALGLWGPFDAALVTAAIAEHRPTSTFCVPTHLRRLFDHWDRVGAPDLSCFRLLAHAGAACPPEVKRLLIDAFPAGTTWEFYGSTEGQFTACRSEEWLERPGTVGRARPGRTMSVDADGALWCGVPAHARFEYWRVPDKTAAAWRGDAFTVGDLGRIDDEGYVYLDARREDLVISGGVNVYPAEVEHVLVEHPGVTEVAVFGVPDPDWGQRVCAAVVGTASEDELRAFAAERLAPPKRPKTYLRVDGLPMTATGKVRRRDLAAELSPADRPGPAAPG